MSDERTDFRGKLAADLLADYETVHKTLQAAMNAEKEIGVNCRYCEKHQRIKVPDYQAALKAAQFWAEQGFGKAAQAEKEEVEQLDIPPDLTTLSPEERKALKAKLWRQASPQARGYVSALTGQRDDGLAAA